MHSNHVHNLMAQLVEDQKSLYRIKDLYKKDAAAENADIGLWEKLEVQKEENIAALTAELKKYLA